MAAVRSERLTVRPCVEAARWDEFVGSIPYATPKHAFAWGKALESCFGYLRLAYRLYYSNGCVAAGLPLIRFSAGWPFRAIYSLVFDSDGGPLIHPDHLDDSELALKISADIDYEAVHYGAFETRLLIAPTAPDAIFQCLRLGNLTVSFKRSCPLLALDRPIEEIVGGYRASVHRAIRRSAQEGVGIEENVDIARVRQAYPIYRATMARIGGTAKPWRLIEALLREKLAIPFIAQRHDSPIGLLILLVSPRMATYWISAATISASKYRPTNALIDYAIRWCHSRRIPMFNFGESPHERPGLVRFKMGWGPIPAESTLMVRAYRPWIQRIWHTLEPTARQIYSVWDRSRTSFS